LILLCAWVIFVLVVNIDRFQYFSIIGKGIIWQAGFFSDQNPWWLYSINISGFVALKHQQVTSQRSPGRRKSICLAAVWVFAVAAVKLLLACWCLGT